MSFPFTYRLGDAALEVLLLGRWNVREVRYDDMEGVRSGYPFWNEHWTNVWPWRYMTVRRKTGFIKNFVISPPDRETFMAELERRIK